MYGWGQPYFHQGGICNGQNTIVAIHDSAGRWHSQFIWVVYSERTFFFLLLSSPSEMHVCSTAEKRTLKSNGLVQVMPMCHCSCMTSEYSAVETWLNMVFVNSCTINHRVEIPITSHLLSELHCYPGSSVLAAGLSTSPAQPITNIKIGHKDHNCLLLDEHCRRPDRYGEKMF